MPFIPNKQKLIELAAQRGLVPGVKARCATYKSNVNILPSYDRWEPVSLGMLCYTDSGPSIRLLGSISNQDWATVIPSDNQLAPQDHTTCSQSMLMAIIDLAIECGHVKPDCREAFRGYSHSVTVSWLPAYKDYPLQLGTPLCISATHKLLPEQFMAKLRVTPASRSFVVQSKSVSVTHNKVTFEDGGTYDVDFIKQVAANL